MLIVDDEPLARRGLKRELERIPGIVPTGECASRDEAVAAIVAERPDVVLLDVQLGRNTAFDVIERIGVDAMPFVIFVTAYDRHALRAFEVHAVDYVLKPVDPDRLREALDRAARLLALEQGASLADRLERLLAARGGMAEGAARSESPPTPSDRLVVHDGHQLAFVEVVAIDWIEACGNYVRLHVGAKSHLIRTTMNRIAERLGSDQGPPHPPGAFVRIRRSALVNPRAILSVERYAKGMFVLSLRGGAKLTSSRYHQAGLRRLLGLGQ